MSQLFYSDNDAEAILKLASRKSGTESVSRESLFATAAELGITPEAVEQAELNFRQEQRDVEDQKAFRKHRKGEFLGHLASYVSVCGGLAALDFFTNDHHFAWCFWVIIFWGFGVASNFAEAFLSGPTDQEKAFRKWQRRQVRRNLISDRSRGLEEDVSKNPYGGLQINIKSGSGAEVSINRNSS